MNCNSCNEAAAADKHCNGCIASATMNCKVSKLLQLQNRTATVVSNNELKPLQSSCSCRNALQRLDCKCYNQLQQLQSYYCCRNALQQLHDTLTMNWHICNEAASAEKHCNCCIATETINFNSCNEAAAAETHCNGCIATAIMNSNSCNELQLQKSTATVALQLQK